MVNVDADEVLAACILSWPGRNSRRRRDVIIVPMVTPNCCSSSTTLKISQLLNALGAPEREPSAVVIALPAGKSS
jgi:hypothetical protein